MGNVTQNIKPWAQKLENFCIKLGKNNKATYPVMAIAFVKGICRPAFTMMDKTEKPDTKKYTALREGLTELIAIPTYLVCGEASAWIAKKLIKDPVESAKASKNLMFIGVCGAALFAIPALCSVAINPIVKKFLKEKKEKELAARPEEKHNSVLQFKPVLIPFNGTKRPPNTPYNNTSARIGMKVGGV